MCLVVKPQPDGVWRRHLFCARVGAVSYALRPSNEKSTGRFPRVLARHTAVRLGAVHSATVRSFISLVSVSHVAAERPACSGAGKLGGKARARVCLSLRSSRLPPKAGRQRRRSYPLLNVTELRCWLLPLVKAQDAKGEVNAKAKTERTDSPHRKRLACALLGASQCRRRQQAYATHAPTRSCSHA